MYNTHLKGHCSRKHSLSNDLEESLLTSVGPNRTYLAVFELESICGQSLRLMPVFLRYSAHKKQLTFIPISDFRIDLNFFNRRKAYYLSNSKDRNSNSTRDRIVSIVDKITFSQGFCVSDKAAPRTYFKIPLPQNDRFFGTIRQLGYIDGIDRARGDALNIINTKLPIIIEENGVVPQRVT